MEYGRLGNSGLIVSKIGLGANNFGWRIDLEHTRGVINRALDHGITFLVTADVYGDGKSEEFIGECLAGRRHEVVIGTKFGYGASEVAELGRAGRDLGRLSESPYERGASRRYVMQAAERSLRRLKTDYIDLYQIHRPDPETPILETLQALDDLVRQGKVRYIGHSNFAAWQIVDAQWIAKSEHLARPIVAEHQYSLLSRDIQRDVLPACRATGLGLLPAFPLASGFLTGKYRKGLMPEGARLTERWPPRMAARVLTDRNFERLEQFEAFATERGHALIELAFGWLLSQSEVCSVIAGATRPEQVDQNVSAGQWRMSPEDIQALPDVI